MNRGRSLNRPVSATVGWSITAAIRMDEETAERLHAFAGPDHAICQQFLVCEASLPSARMPRRRSPHSQGCGRRARQHKSDWINQDVHSKVSTPPSSSQTPHPTTLSRTHGRPRTGTGARIASPRVEGLIVYCWRSLASSWALISPGLAPVAAARRANMASRALMGASSPARWAIMTISPLR